MRRSVYAALCLVVSGIVPSIATAEHHAPRAHAPAPDSHARHGQTPAHRAAARRRRVHENARMRAHIRMQTRRAHEADRLAATHAPGDGTSRSIGYPNRGRLENGVLLPESAALRYTYHDETHRYGTAELVTLLTQAAEHVATTLPGSRLAVGDLSQPRGGHFRPHRSHRSGRDADVGFFYLGEDGAPASPNGFRAVRRDGTANDNGRPVRFDAARSWELVASLVSSDAVPVQYIFVSNTVQRLLLEEASRRAAAPEVIARATAIMMQPRRGSPHRDHFHVRIYCPTTDRPVCFDDPPFHPWVAHLAPIRGAAVASAEARAAP